VRFRVEKAKTRFPRGRIEAKPGGSTNSRNIIAKEYAFTEEESPSVEEGVFLAAERNYKSARASENDVPTIITEVWHTRDARPSAAKPNQPDPSRFPS